MKMSNQSLEVDEHGKADGNKMAIILAALKEHAVGSHVSFQGFKGFAERMMLNIPHQSRQKEEMLGDLWTACAGSLGASATIGHTGIISTNLCTCLSRNYELTQIHCCAARWLRCVSVSPDDFWFQLHSASWPKPRYLAIWRACRYRCKSRRRSIAELKACKTESTINPVILAYRPCLVPSSFLATDAAII
jgi:hypothetical protein